MVLRIYGRHFKTIKKMKCLNINNENSMNHIYFNLHLIFDFINLNKGFFDKAQMDRIFLDIKAIYKSFIFKSMPLIIPFSH